MNDLLEKIYDLQVSHERKLGRFGAKLDSIEANCKMCQSHIHEVSQKVVLHENGFTRHDKKISDLYHRVELTRENTGLHIVETKTRWRTLTTIGAIILGVLTLSIGIFEIIKFLR